MDIKKELETIYDIDQEDRKEWDKLSKSKSPKLKEHLEKVAKNQKRNLKIVKKIIANYGWPTKEQVGCKALSAIWLVIEHSNKETMLKYYDCIKEAAIKGDISRSEFATFQDRLLVLQGQKQLYGTQYIFDKKNKYVLEPIANPKDVNKRRKEVGLPPLEEDL